MKIISNNLSDLEQKEVKQFQDVWFDNIEEIELQTSGSTGEKKVFLAPKKFIRESAKMTGDFFVFNQDSVLLHALPTSFIAGKMMLIRMAEFQTKAVFSSPSTPLDFPDSIHPDFAALTPYQYLKCLELDAEKLQTIKTVLLGGAPIEPELELKISTLKHRVFHSYGMTETYSHVALRKVGQQNAFSALNNITFALSKENTLIIHAPKIGVQNLQTNDVVELINDSEFVFKGRKDFVVNSGGVKLHPEELERKVALYFSGVQFFFTGIKDDRLGEKLALFIESKSELNLNQVLEILTKFERPKHVIYCEKFCYTDSGKINRLQTIKTYLA